MARQGAIGDYVAQLTAKVRRNVLVPDELKGNPKAVFEVKLLPSLQSERKIPCIRKYLAKIGLFLSVFRLLTNKTSFIYKNVILC